MTPWLVLHVLFAALCLSGAEPAAEECSELVKPLSLANRSVLLGEGSLLIGFTSHDVFNTVMTVTQSSVIKMTPENDHMVMDESLKLNGTCYRLKVNFTVEDDVATTVIGNMTSMYHLLPSCDGCFTISGNSTGTNFKDFMKFLNLDIEIEDDLSASAIYFYSSDSSVKDEDRERFMKQAACLGFTGQPSFEYGPDKVACKEDEGVPLPF